MANQTIAHEEIISIRSRTGDKWWSIPPERGQLTAGAPENGTPFRILKVDLTGSRVIEDGHSVRIRGIDQDPWLMPRDGGVFGDVNYAGNPNTDLILEHSDGSHGQFRMHDGFLIRASHGDNLFLGIEDGRVISGVTRENATEFVFGEGGEPSVIANENRNRRLNEANNLWLHVKHFANFYGVYCEYYFEAWVTRGEAGNGETVAVSELTLQWRHGRVRDTQRGYGVGMVSKTDRVYVVPFLDPDYDDMCAVATMTINGVSTTVACPVDCQPV